MSIRSALTGITTLTCSQGSSSFDNESEALARWLELADIAFATMPVAVSYKRYQLGRKESRIVRVRHSK